MNTPRCFEHAVCAAAVLALALALGCQPPAEGGAEGEAGQTGGAKAAPAKAGKAGKPGAPGPARPAERVARRVEVIEVQPRDFDEKIEATAAIAAIDDVTLAARAAGTVKVIAERGDVVEKGQVVATLDQTLTRAAVAQANASVAAAETSVRLAQATYERQRPLFEQKIVSPVEWDNIQAQLAQARAQLKQAKAGRNQAWAQFEYTKVIAPFAGRVEQRFVEPGGQANPGSPVVRIVDTARVKVVAGIPERYATDIRVGAAVDVQFSAYGVPPRTAEVNFVASAIDSSSRTFEVEAVLENTDGSLKPQMVARLRVVRARHPDALVVPLGAVVRDENGDGVFVVTDGEKGPVAARRGVKLGARSGDRVEVAEGLKPGERVVVVGQSNLTDDDPVSIVGGPVKGVGGPVEGDAVR